MNFETATPPALPECTSRENVGSGNNWETQVYNDNGLSGNVLVYNYNSTQPANAWFYTQGIELEAGVDYQISYKFFGSANWPEKMKVAYRTSAQATAMAEQLADYPSVGGAYDEMLPFTVSTAGVYYFGFNAYTPAGNYRLYLDDINITEETAGINDNEISNIKYFPNPVNGNLTINAANPIDNVTVYNLLGQKVMQVQSRSTTVVLDMSSFPMGTYVLKANAAESVSTFKVVKN